MSEKVTATEVLAAIRKKHSGDAVVREVVIDDPQEEGIRVRDRVDWYLSKSESDADHFAHHAAWALERAEMRGIVVPAEVPAGWTLRTSIPRRRIDALIFASDGVTAVEIKVTRADFRRDTPEKRRAWMRLTRRFIYAAPAGVIPRDELPAGCGLWEYERPDQPWKHGLTTVVRAVINRAPEPMPQQVLRALAYRVSNAERAAS